MSAMGTRKESVEPARNIETVVQNRELVQQRHQQICKAATRVFISQGYHRTTVREIAKEAGLSLGSLYSYIRTKDDILYLVFEDVTSALRENIRQAVEGIDGPVERITTALRVVLKTIEQHQEEILLLYQESKSLGRESLQAVLSREAEYVQFFEDILRPGYDDGIFRGDPRLSADIIAYLCSILALRRWNLRHRFSSDEVVDGLIAFTLRALGVAADDSRRPVVYQAG